MKATLAIDIGGSHLKAAVLNPDGTMRSAPAHVETPRPAKPDAVVAALIDLVAPLGPFDRVSIGFPGVVRGGAVLTAPNLGTKDWHRFELAEAMRKHFGKPVRMLNDASIQGLGVIAGKGVECVITMGTGMGFALFENGRLGPHLELSQHPIKTRVTYDHYVGERALERVGATRWNKRMRRVIATIGTLTNFDMLFIGGGNARLLPKRLPPNVKAVPNEAGITGGVRLWEGPMNEVFRDE